MIRKRINILLLLIINNVFANVLSYKKCIITFDGLVLHNVNFKYLFLDGEIDLFDFKKEKKSLEFNNANFKFKDCENDPWGLNIKSGSLIGHKIVFNDMTLQSEDFALMNIGKLEIGYEDKDSKYGSSKSFRKIMITDSSLTPCSDVVCWIASCKEISINESDIILNEPKFGIENLAIPWFDLRIKKEPASGFFTPSVQKDEFDGWHIKLPVYLYFSDHSDLTITPYFGENFGLDMNNKLLHDASIWSLRFNTKYYSLVGANPGVCFHLEREKFAYEGLDVNLLVASSQEYAQYWENKENGENRVQIPSYIYYAKDWLVAGSAIEPDIINNATVYPSLIINKTYAHKGFLFRFDSNINGVISAKNESSLGVSWFLNSVIFNKNINSFFTDTEAGYTLLIAPKTVVFLPFFRKNLSYVLNIGNINFSSGKNAWHLPICMIPYANFTSGYPMEVEHEIRIWSNNFSYNVLVDSVRNILRNPIFKLGCKFPVSNFELDLAFADSSITNRLIPIDFITKLQYVNEYFMFFIKDSIILGNGDHDISFGLDLDLDTLNFKVEFLTLRYMQNMKDMQNNFESHAHLSTALDWKLNKNFFVNGNLVFRIKPYEELVQSNIKLVYKHKCWIITFGIGYGDVFAKNKEDKLFFNFSIGINGIDKFRNVANQFKNLKLDNIDFANKIID